MTDNIVLAVVAHPDDEIIGPGATLAKHAERGDQVEILILAEGATSRDASRDATGRLNEIRELQSAAQAAARVIGAAPPRFGGLPDNRMDEQPLLDVVKIVEATVEQLRPGIVYTHHGNDLNIDHRIVHQAVLTACRPLPSAPWRRIYAFETVSSTEWSGTSWPPYSPTHFVDITDTLAQKQAALGVYEAEMRSFPHARSIENILAVTKFRGASVGVAAAEAFEVVRSIC